MQSQMYVFGRLSKKFFRQPQQIGKHEKMFSNLYGLNRKGTLTVPFQIILPSEP